MASWYLVPSLVKLRDEINARWPRRDKASDGAVGDTSHAARKSSHNPDWRNGGAVRATDTDSNGVPGRETDLTRALVKAAIGDPRVWYVIWNRTIWSRTYGWRALRYTGSNPHDKHVHVSVLEDTVKWRDTRNWLTTPPQRVKPGKVSASRCTEQFLVAAGAKKGKIVRRIGVKRIQQALNDNYGTGLVVDGLVGEATLNAWGKHEARVGVIGRPRVPDQRSLAALSRGRFEVIP